MSKNDTKETGCGVSQSLEKGGCSHNTHNDSHPSNSEIAARTARIESRLVQLMIHLGLDPYKKTYE